MHKFVHDLIRFIPDIAHKLLQHILHGQTAHRAAVFVRHNDHVALARFHDGKHIVKRHGFMHEVYRHEDRAQVKLRPVHQLLEKMVQVQDADDVVDAVRIDRDAGKRGIVCCFKHLVPRVLNVDGKHIHARRDDLVGEHIAKVERALQKLRAVFVDHAFVLYGFKDGFKVILRHGRPAFAQAGPEAVKQHQKPVEYPYDGLCDDHHRPKGQCNNLCKPFRHLHSHDFRHDFTKGEDQHRHHRRCNQRAFISHQGERDHRCYR